MTAWDWKKGAWPECPGEEGASMARGWNTPARARERKVLREARLGPEEEGKLLQG